MKKIIALLIALASLFTLISCGGSDYPPQKSSDEEARVVMSVSFENKTYEIKYELYRALFLSVHKEVDGGDISVWSGINKSEYIEAVDEIIKDKVAEIYAAIHIASKIGVNVYSSDFDKKVKEYIKTSVEGGYIGQTEIEGFGGDYDKYLESLKKMGLNYSVQDLMIRYSLATEEIYKHYAGTLDTEEFLENAVSGALKYTKDDVLTFYNSADCVRVIRAFLPKQYFTSDRAESIRDTIAEKAVKSEAEVASYIIGQTTTGATDIKNGEIIAMHNLDKQYYSELIKCAFELDAFEVSEVININTGYEDAYVILYRTVKTNDHFEECYDSIARAYVQNEIGKIIDTDVTSIKENIKITDILAELDRGSIVIE